MTTTTTTAATTTGNPSWPAFAAGSVGASAVLTAIGTFWSPLSSYEATQSLDDLVYWTVDLGILSIGAAVVFGLVVRTARPERTDRRGLVLAVLSAASILVFWTGLPLVFAGGAASLALSSNPVTTKGKVALTIAVLVSGFAVYFALAG